jgi:hypothetical protein
MPISRLSVGSSSCRLLRTLTVLVSPNRILQNLFYENQGGFGPAVKNIYLAGIRVVEGILKGWDSTFEKGVNRRHLRDVALEV